MTLRTNGLQRRTPGLLDNFFNNDLLEKFSTDLLPLTTLPAVNIKETMDGYEVEMAAPGMKKEDFNIELEGQNLLISLDKKDEREQNDAERFTMREFSYQSFQRQFRLSKQVVDAENIKASYEHGILKLFIPKKEEVKQQNPRKIEIQ